MNNLIIAHAFKNFMNDMSHLQISVKGFIIVGKLVFFC